MGLKGKPLPVLPNAGGFDFANIAQIPRVDPPSARRQILLKGYQHFAGRALAGLQAIRRCADLLSDYRIAIYSAFPDVKIAAELLAQETGLTIDILPPMPHKALLAEYGKSRTYIGLSISDAISTSLLESMVMGAFPIQSGTACADEWIEDGVSGLIVPPEDVDAIAAALRKVLANDALVDAAAEINGQTCRDRLDADDVRRQAIALYEQIYRETR
jgi:glycosyltransferase involved in cell wall biosynthesis